MALVSIDIGAMESLVNDLTSAKADLPSAVTTVRGRLDHVRLGTGPVEQITPSHAHHVVPVVETGELAWYYQHLPGDDWDMDINHEKTLIRTVVDPDPEHVRPLVARWTGEPTPEIRLARRVLLAPDSQWASSVARTVAQSTLEPEDAQALGAYLARTDAGSTPGRGSRVSSLGVQPPEAVWLAYAAEVRAGSIGSIETLADGARANAVVGALATRVLVMPVCRPCPAIVNDSALVNPRPA